ncbi:MAG: hypothetical protein KF773_12415 [Deltaproteobacteria bacterium]|nr:hypothetical protein [Deltaproteobacteria bacterium]
MNATEPLWRALFEQQLTCALLERVIGAAERIAKGLARYSTWSDSQTVHDRLHNVITKTLEGSLHWDPGRIDLERYLVGAVRTQMLNEMQHARSFRHVSLDDAEQDLESLEAEASEALSGARLAVDGPPLLECWSHVMDSLRRATGSDSGVRALIHAYEHGCFGCSDVMAFTGLTRRQYYAAYQSLLRMAKSMDVTMTDPLQQAIAKRGA